jgi:hypothetical protein
MRGARRCEIQREEMVIKVIKGVAVSISKHRGFN